MTPTAGLRRYVPILGWGAEYSRQTLVNDLVVAGIVTVMLIPQSLAFLFWVRRGLKPVLRRLDEQADIIMVERGPYVSYANCGLPYHLGDMISGGMLSRAMLEGNLGG